MTSSKPAQGTVWIREPSIVYGIELPASAQTAPPSDDYAASKSVGGLILINGKVDKVLAQGEAYRGPVDEVIDAQDLIVMPGLINTHHHFYQSLTRSIRTAINQPLFPWLTTLYPIWAEQHARDVEVATRLVLAELLLSGCTTTTDHHYLFSDNCSDPIDVQFEVAQDMGMRVMLTRGSMSLGQEQGGLPPQKVVQREADVLADCERLIGRWHDPSAYAMAQIALAPCSPFSVTPALLRDSAALAAKHDVALHTHLAETEDETAFCIDAFGTRPLDHLEQCDWLRPRTWFAHGVHFNAQEMHRIGAAGAGISHCPSSNMVLSSGICPITQLTKAGVAIGLGVDGSASNDHSNLAQEMRQAYLLQRLTNPEYSHLDALAMATSGGAGLLHRPELGHLRPGAAADVAMFSTRELRFSGAQDELAALLISGAHQAQHVLVNGQWRVRHGELVDIDLDALMHEHNAAAHALWQRAGVA